MVSHLLFAYDFLLFSKANFVEAQKLLWILNTHAKAFGDEINLSKSKVFFNRNITYSARDDIAQILDVCLILGTGKYLRLPPTIIGE